ncbi:GNAT family N-acetyltransferase [Mycobacterium sp.]|uniref:GNAT family N-acetyltransferase n=1 Tax=Mycobacterium sp. TaxID=1785 RepID=UPI003BAFB7A8
MSAVTPFGEAQQPYLLIDYQWHDTLSGDLLDELAAFSRAARTYDAEAGFTALDEVAGPTDPAPAGWLVARRRVADGGVEEPTMVAVVSVVGVDEFGVGTARLVVAPTHRSQGIATLLLEKLFAEAAPAWFGTGIRGVRAIADGDHPAAGRIGRTFGFDVVEETWWLLRMIRQPAVDVPAGHDATVTAVESVQPAVLHHGVAVPAGASTEGPTRTLTERVYALSTATAGATATTRHGVDESGRPDQLARMSFGHGVALLDPEGIFALLDEAVAGLASAGAGAVLAEVNPAHGAVVRACRQRFFQHDQSNLVYAVPLAQPR